MAKTNQNIFSPTLYQIWTAPLGAALPTTPTATPSAAWYELGIMSDQGIGEARNVNSSNVFDAAGTLVAVLRSQEFRTFSFQALEDNRYVRELRYPGSTLSSSGGTSEVHTVTVTGTPTGGTFTLTGGFNGIGTTSAIAYNAAASTVQTAIRTLPGLSGAVVTGSAGGPYTVTYPASLGPITVLTADGSALTGGTSPSVTVVEATPGVAPVNTRHVKPYTGQNLRQFLVRLDKGTKHNLFAIANGEAVENGTITRTAGSPTTVGFDLTPFADSNNDYYQIIDDDPAQAASIVWA